MYCSTCGTEVPGELNYCNRCGASLNAQTNLPAPNVAPMSFTRLVLMMGIIFVVGMGIVFGGAGGLMRRGIDEPAVVFLTVFGIAALFGISAMLIRLWTKMSGLTSQPQQRQPQAKQQSFYEPPRPAQLPPRPANFGSVTDNTTRTFDPVLRESVEKENLK